MSKVIQHLFSLFIKSFVIRCRKHRKQDIVQATKSEETIEEPTNHLQVTISSDQTKEEEEEENGKSDLIVHKRKYSFEI